MSGWLGSGSAPAAGSIAVDGERSFRDAHEVAVQAEHALLHAIPCMSAALVHVDPIDARGFSHDSHAPL
jgi:divalent metal cation (Fe/Co/Zn/Cd) transporter